MTAPIRQKYALTCDPMGGTVKTAQYTVTVGKADSSTLAAATRRGFKLLGWYNQEEDGVKVFDASGKAVKGSAYWDAKGNWIYEADVTVYARWSLDPNAYLIRFHVSDGTGLTSDLGFVYGTSTAFAGWAGSNNRRYDDEMLVFGLGSVTMTAVWK